MALPTQQLHVSAGDVIFRPDDECRGLAIVSQGTIRVSLTAKNGKQITLYRVNPGEICLQTFACLVEGKNYSAEAVAETDLDAEFMSRADFLERMAEDAEFRKMIMTGIAHRFADFEQLVEDVALSDLDSRLARALLALADKEGLIHETHEALAAEIGSARAVISRKLGFFENRDWIMRGRGHILLLDKAALQTIADTLV